MNLHSFTDGVVLGLLAMTGVFLILAIIGLILYAFELIFYRVEKQPAKTYEKVSEKVLSEEGISKGVVAAITAAVYQYLKSKGINKEVNIKIKRRKKINEAYEKLKLERWKNG